MREISNHYIPESHTATIYRRLDTVFTTISYPRLFDHIGGLVRGLKKANKGLNQMLARASSSITHSQQLPTVGESLRPTLPEWMNAEIRIDEEIEAVREELHQLKERLADGRAQSQVQTDTIRENPLRPILNQWLELLDDTESDRPNRDKLQMIRQINRLNRQNLRLKAETQRRRIEKIIRPSPALETRAAANTFSFNPRLVGDPGITELSDCIDSILKLVSSQTRSVSEDAIENAHDKIELRLHQIIDEIGSGDLAERALRSELQAERTGVSAKCGEISHLLRSLRT
jgi:hypothetical protein